MSTAQVRVVKTPNTALKAVKHKFSRVYVTFNSTARPNSTNTVFFSGDVANEDVVFTIHSALQQLRATKYNIVS